MLPWAWSSTRSGARRGKPVGVPLPPEEEVPDAGFEATVGVAEERAVAFYRGSDCSPTDVLIAVGPTMSPALASTTTLTAAR